MGRFCPWERTLYWPRNSPFRRRESALTAAEIGVDDAVADMREMSRLFPVRSVERERIKEDIAWLKSKKVRAEVRSQTVFNNRLFGGFYKDPLDLDGALKRRQKARDLFFKRELEPIRTKKDN